MKFFQISQALCGATLVAALPGGAPSADFGLEGRAAIDTSGPVLEINSMKSMVLPFEAAVEKFANAPKGSLDPVNNTASADRIAASCANPSVRVEWDNYKASDRKALINAFKCLVNTPATGIFPQAKNKYEDFISLHQAYRFIAHENQIFYPWHRYLIWAFEQALRTDCQFTGPLFWFDETKHAGAFEKSDLFSSQYLGTLRNNVNYNVTDGVFAGVTLHVGPEDTNIDHLLSREGDITYSKLCAGRYIDMCLRLSDYKDFEVCIEKGPHGAGHVAVGGVMGDIFASPGDPFFWFHHIYVDRVWDHWQLLDPARRYNVDGFDHYGQPLTLNSVVSLSGVRADVKVKDVVNPRNSPIFCYKYDY